ncbi:hypothetical protein L227DRAFT_192502 [Lentinus tigrinus ALCF2SS1-6]|uniref:Uncharacterized protein n=1 Tax=Lentinus tigrinus ALCF2SS1-6 TaxID=1328759 RepID=A0A5C2S421_9APHY|nr:hypothetical protein L227DRAFT_192502 [Lentinus tigrinus ALCF2SS1-6]
MASHLRPDIEVQDWLRRHNVVVEDLPLEDSSSWPPPIAPFAQLLPENQSFASKIELEHGPCDPQGALGSLADRLDLFLPSACASFLLYGKSHGPLLRTIVIRHIVKLLHPSLTVYDRVDFAMPRSDTGSASFDSAFHPTKGSAEILFLLERGTTACEVPTSAYYRDPSEVPFAHRGVTTSNYTSSTAPACVEEVLDRSSDWRSVEQRMSDEALHRYIEEEEYGNEDDVGEEGDGDYDSDSADSDGGVPFLSGELDPHRHVLSTCHPHPLIPVLCVADELNLLPLMTSTLYQRRALNLEVPVVGILLPRSSTTCKVLFGWVEDIPGPTHALPLVHILAPVLGRVDAGLFDLCKLEHLMRMTQFLAALGPHIAGPIQDSGDPVSDASLPWRADEYMREIAEDRGVDGGIWNWLCDVRSERGTQNTKSNFTGSNSDASPAQTASTMDSDAQAAGTGKANGVASDIKKSPVSERSSGSQSVYVDFHAIYHNMSSLTS